jgi:hypothetical protein
MGVVQWRCSRSVVIPVFNFEIGAPAQTDAGSATIQCGKPEIAHSGVGLFDFRVLCPKRRISCRFSLQTYNRKVLCIDPDSTAVKELVLGARVDREH